LGGLAIGAFVMTSSDDTPKKAVATNNATKKKAADGLFTDEDYKAKFEPLNTTAKNAFMPIVMRKGAGGVESTAPNALPTLLTGGEGGWSYTGTAEIDGHIQAIVENPSTGQGDFLSVGQTWKKAKVIAVTDSTLILEGPDGQQVTIKMLDKLSGGTTVAATGFAPVNPNGASGPLRGRIGRLGIQPAGAVPAPQAVEGDNNNGN